MAKSKGRLLAELLASDGKVKESKSALDISGGKLAPSDIPVLPNSKLENSSISIAGHSTSLGGSVTLDTGDIGEHTNYKYYTEGRARGAISASSGGGHGSVSYNASTGALSVTGVSTEAIQDVVGAMFSSNTESGITVTYDDADGTIDLSVTALNTGNVTEGSNLYYTDARARAAISATGSLSYNSTTGVMSFTMPAQNTSNITEGSNLYYTNARADARITNALKDEDDMASDSATHIPSQQSVKAYVDAQILTKDNTDEIAEGSNLYFTTARARAAISENSTQLAYNSTTGVLTFTQGNTDTVSEGSSNLYYTNARADARIVNAGSANWNTAYGWGNHASGGYAPIASPGLTGTPTAPTAAANTNTTQIATTAFVQTELTDLIDGAPGTLDTLNELAAAINDDSNYNSTLTTALATKLPLAGGTMTGAINMGSQNISAINNATAVSFLSTNGYWVGGTQRMNGSGNLVNIGTISSGAITTSGAIYQGTGQSHYFRGVDNNWRIGSDIVTDSGGLITGAATQMIVGGSANTHGFQIFGHQTSTSPCFEVIPNSSVANSITNVRGSLYVANTKVIDASRNLTNVTGNISMFTNDSGYYSSANPPPTYSKYLRSDTADVASGTYIFSRSSTTPAIDISGNAGASNYNYFMRAGNDGGNKAVHFVNGSTRTADHGANAYVIRNDGGKFVLGSSSHPTELVSSGNLTINNNIAWHAGNDGSGSGLDADLLDGRNTSTSGDANTIVLRTSSGHIYGQYILATYFNASSGNSENPTIGQVWTQSTGDNYLRKSTPAHFKSQLGLWHTGNDGSGSGLDADLLDGQHGSYYRNAGNINAGILPIARIPTSLMRATGTEYNSATNWSSGIFPLTSDNVLNWSTVHNSTSSWGDSPQATFSGAYTYGGVENVKLGSMQIQTYYPHSGSAGNGVYYRTGWESSGSSPYFHTWAKFYDTNNDGSGSGLDADLLDGQHASAFATLLGSNSFSNSYNEFGNGTGSVSNDGGWQGRVNIAGTQHARLDVKSVSDGIITSMFAHTGNAAGKVGTYSNHALHLIINGGTKAILSTSGSLSTTPQGTLWGASNDGSGSGLDADFLDGYNAEETAVNNSIVKRDGNAMITAKKLYLNGGNYEGQIVFGAVDAWRTGIRQHDDSDAELRIWAKNANGRIHIATGYDGQPASLVKPTDGFVVDHNNVGIGNFSGADPSQKLHVKGSVLVESGNVHLANNVGLTSTTTGEALRVLFPGGGARKNNGSSETGAIKITLPVGMTNSMLSFKITVYQYNTDDSFEVHVGGYNYPTGLTWVHNPFGYITGSVKANHGPYAIRFGYDSNSKACVYIGETTTVWSYPQIAVTEAMVGYAAYTNTTWDDNWDVSIATSFESVTHTIAATDTSTVGWHPYNDGSGSGLDADLLDGQHASAFLTAETLSSTNTVTVTGTKYFQAAGSATSPLGGSGGASLQASTTGSTAAYMAFHRHGAYAINWGLDTSNAMVLGGWSSSTTAARMNIGTNGVMITAGQGTLWGASNDGSGSGLDADLLDGVDSTVYFKSPSNVSGWQNNNANFSVRGGDSSNVGLHMEQSNGVFGFQLYSAGGTYGFLDAEWGGWDIQKVKNGAFTVDEGSGLKRVLNEANWSSYVTSVGNADTVDNLHAASFIRSDTADTASGVISFTAGHGAINITSSSILSAASSSWTGNPGANGKIQYHSNRWYIVSDSSSNRIVQFRRDGADQSYIANDGTFVGNLTGTASYATSAGTADQIDSWAFRNTGSNSSVNADTISSNGISYYTSGVTNFSGNATDGALYSQQYSSSWQHQIAGDYRSGQIALRGKNNGTWQSWRKVWDASNDGSGSGLDADLLDGLHAASFIRSDADDSFSGALTSTARNKGIFGTYDSYKTDHIWSMGTSYTNHSAGTNFGNLYGLAYKHTNNSTGGNMGGGHQMVWCTNGNTRGAIGEDYVWHASGMRVGSNEVWHAGNDGSGSGLDADTLDGLNLSASTTNNGANLVMRTDANGYANFGWIYTASGAASGTLARIYCSQDGYLRYLSPSNLGTSWLRENTYNNLIDSTGSGGNMNTVFQNSRSGNIDVWSGSNLPSGTSHVQGIQVRHQSGGHYGFQLVNQYNQQQMFHRQISNNSFGSWNKIWSSSTDGSGSGLDADLLDGNHASSFITTSTTNASALYIRNTSPTIYLRDTDHNSSMVHCNSNIFYILRGATDSTTWSQSGGKWPMELSLTSNSVTFGGNVTAYSDISLKENIKPIGNSMDLFNQIDAKRFNWIVDGKKDIGFIAQDVQAAGLNEVVIEKENRDPGTGELLDTKLTLDYSRMVSVLWDVVKEQQAQIDKLNQDMEDLKNKIK